MDIARRRGVSPIDLSVVRAAAMQLGVPLRRTWLMNRRTAVVAGALLVGVPPATWLCASQAMHVTHAASVSSDSRAADGPHAAVALASVTVAPADVPLPKDD